MILGDELFISIEPYLDDLVRAVNNVRLHDLNYNLGYELEYAIFTTQTIYNHCSGEVRVTLSDLIDIFQAQVLMMREYGVNETNKYYDYLVESRCTKENLPFRRVYTSVHTLYNNLNFISKPRYDRLVYAEDMVRVLELLRTNGRDRSRFDNIIKVRHGISNASNKLLGDWSKFSKSTIGGIKKDLSRLHSRGSIVNKLLCGKESYADKSNWEYGEIIKFYVSVEYYCQSHGVLRGMFDRLV